MKTTRYASSSVERSQVMGRVAAMDAVRQQQGMGQASPAPLSLSRSRGRFTTLAGRLPRSLALSAVVLLNPGITARPGDNDAGRAQAGRPAVARWCGTPAASRSQPMKPSAADFAALTVGPKPEALA